MTVKCLVVGHGPSRDNWEFIRNFDGIIISVDASTRELLEEDIWPDYSVYSETGHTIIRNLEYFIPVDMRGSSIIVVFKKAQMVYIFEEVLRKWGIKYKGFDGRYGSGKNHAVQSVGLYGIAFADNILKADEIHLIGFDYKGLDNDGRDMCETWIERTLHYLMGRRNAGVRGIIIDHSKGNFPTL